MAKHSYCRKCGTKIKQENAEEIEDWKNIEDGWLCPNCNPESDKEW